jgi:hypothetical protein
LWWCGDACTRWCESCITASLYGVQGSMGSPVLCKVLSGVRCAAASMLVELELVSMTVGSQQHANLFAVVGVMLGPCSMVACQWLGWCLIGYTQFVTLTPFGWLSAGVEHLLCSFLQDKELTCAFCAGLQNSRRGWKNSRSPQANSA